jgi:hypothetical protein
MSAPLLWRHLAELQSAPMSAISIAAAGSFAGQIMAVIQGAPLWVYLLAALAPWVPILALEILWTYRHYRWVAVFCVLLVSQALYLLEHVARMVQIHFLGRAPVDAPGVFAELNLERIEQLWSIWALLAIMLLVSRFPRNPWLWVCVAIAAVDAVEHMTLVASYLSIDRAEPQFVLSLAEFATLGIAFTWQVGRTYDAWLARAFPTLPEEVLIETTGQLEELRLRPGERIDPEANRWYVVTRGTGTLSRIGPGGHEILLRVVSPGQVVRGDGTLSADSPLEVLALPAVKAQSQ